LEITVLQRVSGDCIKITISTGLSFFFRTIYLKNFSIDRLVIGETLTEEDYIDLETAGGIFSAEHDAMNYLARAEQCRAQLTLKLLKKNHTKKEIELALNYLEKKVYLSDKRYAGAWLRNRQITKAEGRVKLESELVKKGIDRCIIKEALDEYFEFTSEEELFVKALEKFQRLGKKDEKLQQSLLKAGFSWKLIKEINNI
jgi:regulatory protein